MQVIRLVEVFRGRGDTLAVGWVPGHAGVEGSEIADTYVKATA